jgi:hypothetical protein
MKLTKNFSFKGSSSSADLEAPQALAAVNPLGPLQLLGGIWKGRGFNQIWRPTNGAGSPPQDRFLQLNLTNEVLTFEEIPGDIPNRGLFTQKDIDLHGLTYLQQVEDRNVKGPNGKPAGIHIEPGIWIFIPATTEPNNVATVARLGTIPHGTSILAQGSAKTTAGPPVFKKADITPFKIQIPPSTLPPPPASLIPFPESNLAVPTPFRSPPAEIVGITQAMVNNPNSLLAAGILGKNIIETTTLEISTILRVPPVPKSGGGSANISFLQGTANKPNAVAAQVDATFWIETIKHLNGTKSFQLQYTQRVLLNFANLSWPHISVATLTR